ncbi:TolC family protein, partial [bacterium]|nr:TolC family protein [bacterium]
EYTAQLELAQPLWVAGKVGAALRAARSYVKQTETGVTQTLQDTRVRLAQTFYGVILARELLTTTQTALDRAIQHRDQTRLMYEQGIVSEYDKLRAEVQVANLEPPLLEARNQYELTRQNLRWLLNLDPETDVEVIGSLDLADTILPVADVETAYQQRSELAAIEYARKTQRQLMSIARRDLYLPSFYAVANYRTMTQADNFEFDNYGWVKSSAAMLQVSLPLFDGFRTPARVAQYRAELRRLDYMESDLRNGISIDVENSRRELERALRTVTVQEGNVIEAERAYQIARVRYENGMGTQLELLDSELQLDRSRVNRLHALYDARITRLQLERALGIPLKETSEP